MSSLNADCLSVVLQCIWPPPPGDLSQLAEFEPEWQAATNTVLGGLWKDVQARQDEIGIRARKINQGTSSEKFRRLAENVQEAFIYRSRPDLAATVLDGLYTSDWAREMDEALFRLDREEFQDMLRSLRKHKEEFIPEGPLEAWVSPNRIQSHLHQLGLSNQLNVDDIYKWYGFLREVQNWGLTYADMAYLREPKIKLFISEAYKDFREFKSARFPSAWVEAFQPETLESHAQINVSLPSRFPPNHLRCLTIWGEGSSGTKTILAGIHELSGLQTLDLSSLPVGEIPDGIFNGLNELKTLMLRNTQISALPPSLGSLPNLETLNLYNNQITTVARSFFASLPKLKVINLRLNPLRPQRIAAPFAVTVRRNDGLLPNIPGRGSLYQISSCISRGLKAARDYPPISIGLLIGAVSLFVGYSQTEPVSPIFPFMAIGLIALGICHYWVERRTS